METCQQLYDRMLTTKDTEMCALIKYVYNLHNEKCKGFSINTGEYDILVTWHTNNKLHYPEGWLFWVAVNDWTTMQISIRDLCPSLPLVKSWVIKLPHDVPNMSKVYTIYCATLCKELAAQKAGK